jgi:hypothetical protein
VSSYYYMEQEQLLYMCPHTTIYVSSYYYMEQEQLLYMCPHTTIYVSSYYYMEQEAKAAAAMRGRCIC